MRQGKLRAEHRPIQNEEFMDVMNEDETKNNLFNLLINRKFDVPSTIINLAKKIPIKYMMHYSKYQDMTGCAFDLPIPPTLDVFHRIFAKKYNLQIKQNNYRLESVFPEPGFYFIKKKHHIIICIVTIVNFEKFITDYNNRIIRKYDYYIIAKNPENVFREYITRLDRLTKKGYTYHSKRNHVIRTYVICCSNYRSTFSVFKDLNNLILHNGEDYELKKHINRFIAGQQIYIKNQIKYRMGILLHGNPGTGKTSLVYAISNYFDIPILKITPEDILKNIRGDSDPYQAIAEFGNEHNTGNKTTMVIYLIEELDSLCNESGLITDRGLNDGETKQFKLQRSQVLQFIDSIPGNAILFATTNHIDKIDDALIRPGRFDIKMEMTLFNKEDTIRLISTYPNINASFIDHYKDEDFPICPAQVEFDIVSEICKNMVN